MQPHSRRLAGVLLLGALLPVQSAAQSSPTDPAIGPVFVDGQAQVVDAFKDPKKWIREQLWVLSDFDSDGNGRPDRLHVDVTRPARAWISCGRPAGAEDELERRGIPLRTTQRHGPLRLSITPDGALRWEPQEAR